MKLTTPRRVALVTGLLGAAIAAPAVAVAASSPAPVSAELAMYAAGSNWYAGGQFIITNPVSDARDWSLSFTVPNGEFQNSSSWNIDATVVGDRVTLSPKSGSIAGNATEYISFGISGDGADALSITSCDLDGNAVTGCSAATGDTEAPSLPGSLTADANDESSVHVMWQHSTDNVGVAGYKVFQDGIEVKEVGGTTRMTNITGLAPATEYSFAVQAFDAAGNASERTKAVKVTTPGAPIEDTEAPERITDLAGFATGARTVDLTWSTPKDNVGVTSYKIYNGVDNAKPVTVAGDATSATITGLKPSTGYSFQIHSFDAAGNMGLSDSMFVETLADAPVEPGTGTPADFTAAPDSYLDGDQTVYRMALGWKPAQATTRYEIHVDGKFAQTLLVGMDTTDVQKRFVVTGTKSTTHTVKVRAMLADGTWSAFTPELTVSR